MRRERNRRETWYDWLQHTLHSSSRHQPLHHALECLYICLKNKGFVGHSAIRLSTVCKILLARSLFYYLLLFLPYYYNSLVFLKYFIYCLQDVMLLESFADTAMCHYTRSLEIAVCKGLELYLIIIDLFHKYL